MAEKQILLTALDARWKQLRKEWNRTRRKYSEDSVHDLRVASRRLIAVLDTLLSIEDHPSIRDCRRPVKKSLNALSPLRDLQVLRSSVSTMTDHHPELKGFEKSLSDDEDRIGSKLKKVLKRGPGLGRELERTRRQARKMTDNKAILNVIDKRYRKVMDLAGDLDPANTDTIHRMRLAFKKFRYTCEVAHPIIEDKVDKERLDQFHSFQTMMGDIQDVEVFSAKLSHWADKKDRQKELQPVFDELKKQRQERIRVFMASAGQVKDFWKPGPRK